MESLGQSLIASTISKPGTRSPRILFLEPQPCIRALKYAEGLKWAFGGNIRIAFGFIYHTLNKLYGRGDEVFDNLVKLNPDNLTGDIRRLAKEFKPLIIHSHNAPDLLTISAIEAVKGEVPVIHDCHEALTLRDTGYYASDGEGTIRNEYPRQEKVANEGSDGRIYVTEGVRDYIQRRYDVDPSRDMVFYSYVSNSMLPNHFQRKLSERDGQIHVVYIGTVTSKVEDSHYDLRDIFREIADQGIHLHMYVSIWGARDKAYRHLADENDFIHYHGHLDQRILLYEITKYDYGWAGFNVNQKNRKHLDVALPNKVFEYIACGLPVLAFPHKNLAEFLGRFKVGLVFNSVDEMASQIENMEIKGIRKHVLSVRDGVTVEKNIHNLINYYEKFDGGVKTFCEVKCYK